MISRAAFAFVLVVLGFALTGCGLTPVYGKYAHGGAASPVGVALDNVYIENIPNRMGQKLRNLLMDRMYKTGRLRASEALYKLDVESIRETIYGIGIAKDATATRSQIVLTTIMTLTRANDPDGAPLITRTLNATSSFNTLASQYTTLVTEEDARNQAIQDLSEQIVTQMELYFSNPAAFPHIETKPEKSPEDTRTEAQKRIDNQRFHIDQ